jgi:hypothetical protein
LLRSLLLRLLLLLHLLPKHLPHPKHHRLRRVLLFQVVLLRANQRVTSLVKRRARLHHDPTHLLPIHRDRLLVERLVALLARRLVVR